MTENISAGAAAMLEMPEEFSARLGLQFKNIFLLVTALTHRSYLNENPDALVDNERLEFLGDAVLDYLVAAWLYKEFPEMQEGKLTRLRAALVDTRQLSRFARDLQFGRALRLGRGEEDGGGRERESVLCAAFEAVVGAISLDQGLDAVTRFIYPMLNGAVEEILDGQNDKDAKSRLQEWSQERGYGVPVYDVINVEGPDHARVYEVVVYVQDQQVSAGKGTSKQRASMQAAEEALNKLGID